MPKKPGASAVLQDMMAGIAKAGSAKAAERNAESHPFDRFLIQTEFYLVPTQSCRVSPLADRWEGEQYYDKEMADSYGEVGQIQPSVGRLRQDDKGLPYIELLAGIMRYRGALKAGSLLKVWVVDCDDDTANKIIVEENRRRHNPSAFSLARKAKMMLGDGYSKVQVKKMMDWSDAKFSHMIGFADLPESVLNEFGKNILQVPYAIGYHLAKLANQDKKSLARAIQLVPGILNKTVTKADDIYDAPLDKISGSSSSSVNTTNTQSPRETSTPDVRQIPFVSKTTNRVVARISDRPNGRWTLELKKDVPNKLRNQIEREVKRILKELK